ncbi:MAG TPA: PAS domain S-box protein [Methanospirillum sp.]|nr:PAS domain S-box protein [Methanospirillum sp.]
MTSLPEPDDHDTDDCQLRREADRRPGGPDTSSGDMKGKSPEALIHELRVHQRELEIRSEEVKRAHQDLEDLRERYLYLYDFAPVGYFTLTRDALIAEVNLTGAAMLGVVREDLIRTCFREVVTPLDREQWDRFFLNILNEDTPQTSEFKLNRLNGTNFQARIEGTRVEHRDGSYQVRFMVSDGTRALEQAHDLLEDQVRQRTAELSAVNRSLLEEIGERSRVEISLRESEERFRILLQNIPWVSIQGYTKDGTTQYWDEASEKLYGYSAQEAIGKNLVDLIIPPEMRAEVSTSIERMFTSKQPIPSSELYLMKKDGTRVAVFSGHILLKKPGDEIELFCIDIDLSERKQIEEALRKRAAFLEAQAEASPDGMLIVNEKAERILINHRLISMWDIPDTLLQDPNDEALLAYVVGKTKYPEKFLKKVRYLYDNPHESSQDIVEFLDGNVYERYSAPVIDCDGRHYGRIWTFRDITERRKAEEALQESSQKLRLLTGLTRHDLLNKLNSMQIFHNLAIDASDLMTNHEYISYAHQAGIRMEAIIGFTREYENFGIVSSDWIRIYPLIESARAEVSLDRVIVQNEIPDDLEVYADPIIRKVFSTLIENAIRHGGAITAIRISCNEIENALILICEDDGVGVPSEEKEYIFDHGYGKHTGIGLFLAREILSITGLSIQECGEPGNGARFEILVPAGKYRKTIREKP